MANHINRRPARLRTFAADLEAQKNAQNESETTSKVAAATHSVSTPVIPKDTETKLSAAVKDSVSEFTEKIKTELPPPKFTTPRTPEKIPAFHELEKSVKAIQENIVVESKQEVKQRRKKKKEKPSQPVRANIGFDTAIITDTKSDRFKLLPSMLDSVRIWFKKIAEERKRRNAPKYTVADADRRKGVIQRATSKTGTIFSADNETIREQIRLRQIQAETEEAKQAEIDEAETIWSPYTETGFSLLEAPIIEPPVTQNVVVSYKKTLPTTQNPEEEEEEIVEPSSPATVETFPTTSDSVDEFADERWNTANEPENSEPNTVPLETSTIDEDSDISIDSVSDLKEIQFTPSRTVFSTTNTNTLTVALLITIICVVAVIFAARIIMTTIAEHKTAVSEIISSSTPILQTEQMTSITLTAQNLHLIPTLITTAIASSSEVGITEYALVSGIGDEISPSYLFELLQFKTMPILRQSLSSVHFASVEKSSPAIILDFVTIDAVRGGLLNWESTMVDDLRVLYDVPATTTVVFIDEKIDTHDVRVLQHKGTTVLIYGIVDSNTAVIAQSSDDFAKIITDGITQ